MTYCNSATALQETEAIFCSSYVRLCNNVLDRLGSVTGNLPLRDRDKLNIRFQHDDYYPGVIISSAAALLNAHKNPNPDFTKAPSSQLPWSIILLSNEFDIYKGRCPEGIMSRVFTKEPGDPETDNSLPDEMDIHANNEEEAEEDRQIHVRSKDCKRSLDVAAFAGDEEQPLAKRVHTPAVGPPETPSGLKRDSFKSAPTWEITFERDTKASAEHRFKCASYGVEMLSCSAGVHHAINLLFTGTYFSKF